MGGSLRRDLSVGVQWTLPCDYLRIMDIIDISQVQIGGGNGRKERTCYNDDSQWSGINMQH